MFLPIRLIWDVPGVSVIRPSHTIDTRQLRSNDRKQSTDRRYLKTDVTEWKTNSQLYSQINLQNYNAGREGESRCKLLRYHMTNKKTHFWMANFTYES